MANRKKPTNKEMLHEIQYLGQRLVMMEQVLNKYVSALDLYILFQKNDDKFREFIEKKLKEQADKKEKAVAEV